MNSALPCSYLQLAEQATVESDLLSFFVCRHRYKANDGLAYTMCFELRAPYSTRDTVIAMHDHNQQRYPNMMKLLAIALTLITTIAQDCSLCPDGSFSNMTLAVPLSDDYCGDLEKVARKTSDATACKKLQRNAAWCQCPNVEPMCTLCPLGVSPPNGDKFVEEANVTCGELSYLATVATNAKTCNLVTRFASACGCTNCTSICPDGSPLATEWEDTIVGDTTSAQGSDKTCGYYHATAASGILDQEKCSVYAHIGVYACGCDAAALPEPLCKLCENDQVPPNLGLVVDAQGSTCVEFMTSLANVNDTDACFAFQATAGVYCGCENPAASASACRICGNSTLLPNPQRVADTQNGLSCAEAEYVANLNDTYYCNVIQENFAPLCCGPEKVDPYDTDGLSYSDDRYITSTLPPAVSPTEQGQDFATITSSTKGTYIGTVSIVTLLLVGVLF